MGRRAGNLSCVCVIFPQRRKEKATERNGPFPDVPSSIAWGLPMVMSSLLGKALSVSRSWGEVRRREQLSCVFEAELVKQSVSISYGRCDKVPQTGGLSMNLWTHGSGGRKSKLKVLAGLVPLSLACGKAIAFLRLFAPVFPLHLSLGPKFSFPEGQIA